MSIKTTSSFNNISFYIRNISDQGYNNQTVLHDIAKGKYGPVVEVMGRGPEIYEVEGFCDDTDGSFFQANALRQSIMKKSTGSFLHPTLGVKNCAVLSFGTSLDAARSGLVEIRLTLVVVNNSQYSIGTSKLGGLKGLVQRATNIMTSTNLDGIGGSALSVLGAGEGIMKSISGFDPVLNTIGQTMGRFYQAGQIGSSILNDASTLTDAIPLVESKASTVKSTLMDDSTSSEANE